MAVLNRITCLCEAYVEIIIIQTFVRCTLSASELNLRRRQLLGGEDG